MYIKTGKDLIDSHITKFAVRNGAWIGEVGKKDGDFVIYCKDLDGHLINTATFDEQIKLELTIFPLAYENELYAELADVRREINECVKELYGEEGWITLMKKDGYSEDVMKENLFVKGYTQRFEKAKLREIELKDKINELEQAAEDMELE